MDGISCVKHVYLVASSHTSTPYIDLALSSEVMRRLQYSYLLYGHAPTFHRHMGHDEHSLDRILR